ncbi:diguanylate cyclase [Alkalilimnicola ehrlichii]|uniref:diguanylate cyclase n=1 Tax=Alkalilimnicola ehrlichii TaxID=351052 RepID=A0A3E0X0S4_9GAMM|nr:diguanylate cyclase [Alkalilimnicola ehrlichii]RFA39012.1 hypothetical protein CAL65_03720 [Alkalilimnicola ehrlichii]
MTDWGDESGQPQGGGSVANRVAELERLWLEVHDGQPRTSALEGMLHETRQLALEAPAAGYPKVADLASIMEVMLSPAVHDLEPLTGEFKDILRDYIQAVIRLSGEPPDLLAKADGESAEDDAEAAEHSAMVFILEPHARLARDVAYQVEHFGYRVLTIGSFGELVRLARQYQPHAVVMDLEPLHDRLELAAACRQLRASISRGLPIILLSEQADLESRLAAARAGVDAYLVKPFDMHELIDQLDQLSAEHEQEPFHIIIVEDSATQATYFSTLLSKAGMVPTVVSDPMDLLDVLAENAADLVLMDMYMPGCNGMELARVIRQFPRFASIPIVYLSAETEIDRQLDAMSLGGDDFLTKPINPAHLIRSVAIRAERARNLRTFMLTDNLTGLLNHTRIKEQLHSEVARAARHGTTLAFAMLDIDHFKSVNDTYGHHVGDRVIKTLARVLKQRLRKTDYIGRYGGEEFAVILVDADEREARSILDEIRVSFSKIRQFTSGGGFVATFSGGVASFPGAKDAVSLALEADKALYVAKKAGRNRICAHISK